MANKLIARYTLLLSLGAIMMMSVSAIPASKSRAWKANMKAVEKAAIGVWRLTSNLKSDDFVAYVKAMEFSEEAQEKILNSQFLHLVIMKLVNGEYNYKLHLGDIIIKDVTFFPGREDGHKLSDGRSYNSTVAFDGNDKMIVNEQHANFVCYNVYDFREKAANVQCNGAKARLTFDKLPAMLNPTNSTETPTP